MKNVIGLIVMMVWVGTLVGQGRLGATKAEVEQAGVEFIQKRLGNEVSRETAEDGTYVISFIGPVYIMHHYFTDQKIVDMSIIAPLTDKEFSKTVKYLDEYFIKNSGNKWSNYFENGRVHITMMPVDGIIHPVFLFGWEDY